MTEELLRSQKILAVLRRIYHWLPVSSSLKWQLRRYLSPYLNVIQEGFSFRSLKNAAKQRVSYKEFDYDYNSEYTLYKVVCGINLKNDRNAKIFKVLVLPFFSVGGASQVAINICRALQVLCPEGKVLVLSADSQKDSDTSAFPENCICVSLDSYLKPFAGYDIKEKLLYDLIMYYRPTSLHNINSEVAWNLIINRGSSLKKKVSLFASIFAFQYVRYPDKKIGYAANFLEKGIEYLSGLIADNSRFIDDAVKDYKLEKYRDIMHVLYQPVEIAGVRNASPVKGERPRFLWAGRLDSEKRVDLLFEIVKVCPDIDFYVYGQAVVEDGSSMPVFDNLFYKGPFTNYKELIKDYGYNGFVFTSKWEGMPNILLEVASLGIPVIAPNIGGVSELINSDTGYLLSRVPDSGEYRAAMRSIIENPEVADAKVTALHSLLSSRHSWDSFISETDNIDGYAVCSAAALSSGFDCEPLVSVVIPCYNQAQFLFESVRSVENACLNTSYEIIIINDGSTDTRTVQFINELPERDNIRIIHQENAGLSATRNNGIRAARGKFIQFLDSDDMLAPNKIDFQIEHLKNNAIDVSVCNFILCDDSLNTYVKPDEAIARFDLTHNDFLYKWERGFAIPIHCGLFRADVLKDNLFCEHLQAKEDWVFWTNLSLKGFGFGYLPFHGAFYRQHAQSMRRSNMNMGRSWLEAGLFIEKRHNLKRTEPQFFETVVAWFEQCYRNTDNYKEEMSGILKAGKVKMANSNAIAAEEETDLQIYDELCSRLNSVKAGSPVLISVVIPVYNHYKYLIRCLNSLADQDGGVEFEIVVVDDFSSDKRVRDMLDYLRSRLTAHRIVLMEKNSGISNVQNIAVDTAKGEYIAFLDCDDMLRKDAISTVVATINSYPSADYIFTDRTDIDENDKPIRNVTYGGYENIRFKDNQHVKSDLLDGMVASHLKIIRKNMYMKTGGSNSRYSGVQDWELALNIASHESIFHYLAKPLYMHRIHGGSVTSSLKVSQFRKTNEVRRMYCDIFFKRAENKHESRTFSSDNLPVPIEILKENYMNNIHQTVLIYGKTDITRINFLREFNSYFDEIIWEDPRSILSLYGYLSGEISLTKREL